MWERRLAVVALGVAAVAAGVLAGYNVSLSPLDLEKRSTTIGVASKQILVDNLVPGPTNLKVKTTPLVERTTGVVQLLTSARIRTKAARLAGIPAREVTTEGPFVGPAEPQNIVRPSEARGLEIDADTKQYRLSFVAQRELPIVSIHARAPTEIEAARLADAAYVGVDRYLDGLRHKLDLNRLLNPVVVRELGPATAGTSAGGDRKAAVLLAFFGVLLLGLVLLLGTDAMRRRRRRRRRPPAEPPEFAPLDLWTPADPRV